MKRNKETTGKKSVGKILLLLVLGALVAFFGTLTAIFYIEDAKPVCWKSGEVVIDGQPLTLPCSVAEFEEELNTSIPEGKYLDVISEVTLEGSRCPVVFKVYLSDDLSRVIGIIAREDTIGESYAIVFPGGVTLDSEIEEVVELYSTKPLNIYHSYWSEDIVFTNSFSEGYRYVDKDSFEMEVSALDGNVDEIFYCYIADE